MKHTWVLIANASQARCYARAERDGTLSLVEGFSCPESRLKGVDLESDRVGHEEMGYGRGSTSFDQGDGPRAKVRDAFARKLAGFLSDGVAGGRCGDLLVFASSPFLGLVKMHLSEEAGKVLAAAIARDLTGLDADGLAQQLRDTIPRNVAR